MIQFNQVEQKGLGLKLGVFTTSLGDIEQYMGYANLIEKDGQFNVSIMNNPVTEVIPKYRFIEIRETAYLFPEMVSEQEAREKYDSLR